MRWGSVGRRWAAVALLVVSVLAAAWTLRGGQPAAPAAEPSAPPAAHAHPSMAGMPMPDSNGEPMPTPPSGMNMSMSMAEVPTDGLSSSLSGYTLHLLTPTLGRGEQTLRLRVDAPDGTPLTDVADDMTAPMHLVIVRTDLTGYQHVHPQLRPAGTWSVGMRFTAGGAYRAYASLIPQALGAEIVMSAPLTVTGPVADTPLPAAATVATVDGYTVTFRGQLVGGMERTLMADVRRDGRPVTTLQPYLGAYGHLVAVRAGTLEYTHVHPVGRVTSGTRGPALTFEVTVTRPGAYRLFLQFNDAGAVHTAEITLPAT